MKPFMIFFFSCLVLLVGFPAYGAGVDTAQLRMSISTPSKTHYAVCINDTCFPLIDDNRTVRMETSKVDSIVVTEMTQMVWFAQKMPASCAKQIAKNQTFRVTGHLEVTPSNVVLKDLHCSLS